ncbi:RNI-like protein [Coniophora puteana RWD-64-598 SS2]|uniref:RNI-like protein n=1 Tax=Coniophora puteana (strain RWD-64-598) TaxID=741705 RepID=A0A5M3MH81_CONPW|nr:RNI-like protein [Coniophora puteana RWD-64-598 SS2]EIW78417.1 RNI-like protein [Coniophora puteana RWD-64-598 SS2]
MHHIFAGAQKVIDELKTRRNGITKLVLNHNVLQDEGTAHLFCYLTSDAGAKHRASLTEICLNRNEIGSQGLYAVVEFLRDNIALKTLYLANNRLSSDGVLAGALAEAVSSSRLQLLSLSGNNALGNGFIAEFLGNLRSQYLVDLEMNTAGCTSDIAQPIAEWLVGDPDERGIPQRKCSVQTFKCSGNNLGARGVWEIKQAIERGNWSLMHLEVHANQLPGPPPLDDVDEEPWGPETMERLKALEQEIALLLRRNEYWKKQIEEQALVLLRYSRLLLLQSAKSIKARSGEVSQVQSRSQPIRNNFAFFALPLELQQYILSFFAPMLSSAQCARIYNYAAKPSTLPPLLVSPKKAASRGCLLDPSSFYGSTIGFEVVSAATGATRCAEGQCMGAAHSLSCRREEDRGRYLEAVDCRVFEPEPKRMPSNSPN